MKKIWKFIKKWSTLLLIGFIVIIIAVFVILAGMFLPKTEGNIYGNRLNDIEKHSISNELKNEVIKAIEDTSKTKKQTFNIKGKIIKINIEVNDDTSLEDAKKLYDSFKEKLTEELLSYYDIEIIVYNKDYASFGYLKSGNKDLKWTNNK